MKFFTNANLTKYQAANFSEETNPNYPARNSLRIEFTSLYPFGDNSIDVLKGIFDDSVASITILDDNEEVAYTTSKYIKVDRIIRQYVSGVPTMFVVLMEKPYPENPNPVTL